MIEHVGSTAVPAMCAKPIVDILVGARSLAAIEKRIPALAALGYRYVPEFEQQLPLRRYFVKPAQGKEMVHIHAVEFGGEFWREQMAFRDALRSDARVFAEYAALKRRLARLFPRDRGAYTDGKAAFIRRVLDARPGREPCNSSS